MMHRLLSIILTMLLFASVAFADEAVNDLKAQVYDLIKVSEQLKAQQAQIQQKIKALVIEITKKEKEE